MKILYTKQKIKIQLIIITVATIPKEMQRLQEGRKQVKKIKTMHLSMKNFLNNSIN